MAVPLTSGNTRSLFARLEQQAGRRMGAVVTGAALAVERQAKQNASTGSHPRGTPTPAVRGSTGPAVVTGNLRRNITHERTVRSGNRYVSRVGVARGAPYGDVLERELGYRFIVPAAAFVAKVVLPVVAHHELSRIGRPS